MITDKVIMRLVGTNISGIPITSEMLEIPPPVVDVKMPIHALQSILEYFEYVLVEKNGKSHSILVRQDLNQLLDVS